MRALMKVMICGVVSDAWGVILSSNSSSAGDLSVRYVSCDAPGPTPSPIAPCPLCDLLHLLEAYLSRWPIRYANGGATLVQNDLAVPEGGFFSHVRYYCNQSSAPFDGPNGFNWWVQGMPYVVASGTSVSV